MSDDFISAYSMSDDFKSINSMFYSMSADFMSADFKSADFKSADFKSADFKSAELKSADSMYLNSAGRVVEYGVKLLP